ncbi:MAG: efflux RND transporter periplasmic adaptor subunit [Candidatus Binatia bacterium]
MAKPETPRKSKKPWGFVVVLLLLLPVAAYYGKQWWQYSSTHVTTDNAYVAATIAQITPRIHGVVTEVLVGENWRVKPGQVLARLDPQDYEVRLAQAEAALVRAREEVDQLFVAVDVAAQKLQAAHSQVEVVRAEVNTAQASFRQAELDLQRAKALFAEEIIPAHLFDKAKTHYDGTLATLHAKQKQLEQTQKDELTRHKEYEQAKAALGGEAHSGRYERALVQEAEATVREARLNMSYCTLVAPIEGVVSRKSLEVGQRVQPGQPLMAIVPLERVYVEANYKETQLSGVRVGQPVEIRADIYPDVVYHGKVDSLSAGTGAAFSLLPPENATGNWVKVVQRLPVKVILDQPPSLDHPLRVGLSVEVTIDTTDQTGSLVSSLRQQAVQQEPSHPANTAETPTFLQPPSSVARVAIPTIP